MYYKSIPERPNTGVNCAGIVEGIQLSKKILRTVGALRVSDDNVRFGDVEYGHDDWPTICQILFNSIWYSNLERTSLKGLMARKQTSKQIKRVQGNYQTSGEIKQNRYHF